MANLVGRWSANDSPGSETNYAGPHLLD